MSSTEIQKKTDEEIQKKTDEINERLRKTKNSTLTAWEIGQDLNKLFVEDFDEDEGRFKEHLLKSKMELGLDTAKKYMQLSKEINKEDISEHMIVSHLYPLLDVKEVSVRVHLLKIMKDRHQELTSVNFTAKNVNSLVNFCELTKDVTIEKIEDQVNKIINEKINEKQKKKERKNRLDRNGKRIKSDYFPDLLDFFPNEPIDEQGLVGLFCSMFPLLRDQKFQMDKYTIRFDKIQYIRTQFPDARIEAENVKKGCFVQIHTEFEYQSKNFFTHKHHEVKNKQCDLIVCWEDNLNSSYKGIPLVLSMQNVLQEGKIELVNHDKT